MRFLLPLLACLLATSPCRAQPQKAAKPGYLCVLGDPAMASVLKPLLDLRRRGGLAVRVLPFQSARALQARVAREKPRYLLLVGSLERIPAFSVRRVATDRPYGDFDRDGLPEVSIGRIPFDTVVPLARVVSRLVDYETRAPGGAWRRRVSLLAGEGRFTPALDRLMEGLFTRVVGDELDPGYDVNLTYASPNSAYHVPAADYGEHVLRRLAAGSLVFAYVGHGQVRGLDSLRVRVPGRKTLKRYPVLNVASLARLKPAKVPPLILALACWTACLDDPKPGIGESLLGAKHGALAFFGSSRISHPAFNALLGRALIAGLLNGRGPRRLGPVLDAARRGLVVTPSKPSQADRQFLLLAKLSVGLSRYRREASRHVDMYQLLGDPALKLRLPDARVSLDAPGEARAGGVIRVRGRAPFPGALSLTLEVPRTEQAEAPSRSDPARLRHARANSKVLHTELLRTDTQGRFTLELRLPQRKAGRLWLKAFVSAGRRCALGARALKLAPPRAP